MICPWNPTNERLDWLDQLTAGSGFDTDWMGRATLETMAAENPALVDYYFGDGGESLQVGRSGEEVQLILERGHDRHSMVRVRHKPVDSDAVRSNSRQSPEARQG